jgi:23S rRNA U2552 (ribose-2'-O)-methylase RlmE/FtsJ
MSNIVISDIDIIDVKLTDIMQLSEQAKLFFESISENYNINLFNIYLDFIHEKIDINLLKIPIINKINNNDYSNKHVIPIINDIKYTYGNAVVFNTNNTISQVNWGENQIGENLKLKYNNNLNLYEKDDKYFLDFFNLLENNTIFTTSLYTTNTFDNINVKNKKLYVIRDCKNTKCIQMIGTTYIRGKNKIDDYTYSKLDFDDRIVLENDNINVVGYKLHPDNIINNIVYISQLKDHGFINSVKDDIYEVYVLADDKLHTFSKKQIEILDINKYYYFKNPEEEAELLHKLVPSLENILYSINFKSNVYSLDKIVDIINLFDYRLTDISICNVNLISNLLHNKIEEYKSTLYMNTFKYNYYLNYYTKIRENTEINELIIFYLNNLGIVFSELNETVSTIIKDNRENILNIFNDILNNNQLLCKNYNNNTYICENILLKSEFIIKYKLHKIYEEFNDDNKEIFLEHFNKIIELIIYNYYYTFIKKYYKLNNYNINLYNNPLYSLSHWLNYISIDNGATYYLRSYANHFNSPIDNIIINELKENINVIIIDDNIEYKIVKEYNNILDLNNDNNLDNILHDLKYTDKKEIISTTIEELNNILLNGYKGNDNNLYKFYNNVNKAKLIDYILLYNTVPNNIYYTMFINNIKLSINFVKNGELAVLHNKYYIRKNNIWEIFDNYEYNNLYNTKNIGFNYENQLDYLTNKHKMVAKKYYNVLYDLNINITNVSNEESLETKLDIKLYENNDDVKSNIEFNILTYHKSTDIISVKLEDYIDKLDYKDNGFTSIKEFYKLKNKKYGNFKLLDDSKSEMDKYPEHERRAITHGFQYYFKYEFVKFISNVDSIIPGGVNRAFYKCYDLLLPFKELLNKKKLYGAFIAEAPGSFIHCVRYLRNDTTWDKFKIITLIDDENTMFQNSFYKIFNKQLLYNKTNNGDVTKKENLLEFKKYITDISNGHLADISTADGGFAMSEEWYKHNIQENLTTQVIFGEIIAAIITQAHGGVFILKVFDMYTDLMVKMLFLLQLVYDKVLITKPVNSRIANSEKYITCSGFKYTPDSEIRLKLEDILLNIIDNWDTNIGDKNTYKLFELFPSVIFPSKYIDNMKAVNNYFGKSTIFIQSKTYESIKDKEFKILISNYNRLTKQGYVDSIQYFESRINDAKKYCIHYGLPYICKYNNVSKCPHNHDIKNAIDIEDIKKVIRTYKVEDNDFIILNEIYELINLSNLDLPFDLNKLLLMFKNNDTTLDPKIKYYLGNFICKYCYEPIICKHHNLQPNINEVVNYYGVYDDTINCYICGEHLSDIDDMSEDFNKSGTVNYKITSDDINYLNNGNNKIWSVDKTLQIEQFFKIYKYKQNVVDENISLMNLVFNHLNNRYLTNEYNMDDIYIIYKLLYNDFIKDLYVNISNIIQENMLKFDEYKNIFRDLFLITKTDNMNTKNMKNIFQNKFKIPPITSKSELITYINNFYNNTYLYYYNHYFAIILFSITVFKLLIQDKLYIDSATKKLDNDLNIINEINYKLLDTNIEFNLFSQNIILFNNLNVLVNNGLNSSQYNKLFNVSTFNNKDHINSKSILVNLNTTIEEYIKPKLSYYIETERVTILDKPKLVILYKPLTVYKNTKTNNITVNLSNTLDKNNFFNNLNFEISYIDKIRVLLLFHYEEVYVGEIRIFDKNNMDIKTKLHKNKITNNISLLNLSDINKYYDNILIKKQLDNIIDISKNLIFEDYYKYIEHNLNISFDFIISSDLDIINYYKNKIIKQKYVKYNGNNLNIIKYNSILHNIKLVVSFISNYNKNNTFHQKYIKYKYKYAHLYENIIEYLLHDFHLFDNYNEVLNDNNILLKYFCIYIKNNILNIFNFNNNGSNYILTYIYPYILHKIINDINNISADKLAIYLKSININNVAKLTSNLENYKNKIFSIIQIIIDTNDKYKFNDHFNIINISDNVDNIQISNDFNTSLDLSSTGIDENNINFINNLSNLEDNLDANDNEQNYEHFDFIYEDYDQDYNDE